nr:hypothetical protein DGKKSRWO_DGKKSRWO_CDS_0027 [uncultured phage]CAI9752151.1 hypothetical protein CVNMHQAP_CVNMHQAP_CDS_0027 [uncultured phage]
MIDVKRQAINRLLEVYEEIPVNIDEFLENPLYLGGTTNRGKAIYPAWRVALREIFADPYKYTSIILTGCIGSGKSTIAVFIALYMLYCLMCLKDPHKYFGIEATQNNIMFIFNNLTLSKAFKGVMGTFMGHCLKSPWFMARGKVIGDVNKTYLPNKRIRFDIASEEYHVTSTDCFCFIFDEANDVLHSAANYQDSYAMQILNAANQRIRSRFRAKDRSTFFGKSIVISSKQSEMAFLEQYTQDMLNKDPNSVYVFDKPQWEVIPIELSGKTFNVAYGNKNAKSRIMSPEEDVAVTKSQGYQVLAVPYEYRKDFEDNLNRALTEVAGVSISYIDKFFSREYVSKSIDNTRVNPFSTDIIVAGLRDSIEYKDYFDPSKIPAEWQTENIYMHFDTSTKKDRTGISAVSQSRTNPEEIHHLFTVYIEAPKNDQICFKKHEDFVFYLYDTLGWNIKNISSDGFNSAQLKQNFMLHGIEADYISPDRTTVPYLSLQRLLYDGLLKMLNIPLLEKELVDLNMDNVKLKIDHPVNSSKDGSDSLACAVQNCINHRTVDEYVVNEFAEEDLLTAFSNKQPTVIESTMPKVQQTTPVPQEQPYYLQSLDYLDNNVTMNNNNTDEVDMEYFRF